MNGYTNRSKQALIFDMNETLINLEEVQESMAKTLKRDQEPVSLCFEMMPHYSLVDTLSDQYHPFGEIGTAALVMMAKNRKIGLNLEKARQVLQPIRKVQSYLKYPPPLKNLKRLL
jgi:2-haloacid dehalogenase